MGGAPVWGEQPTLVADAHVNSALPTVNSGAISNLDVGGGYTTLLAVRPVAVAGGDNRGEGVARRAAALLQPGDHAGAGQLCAGHGVWGEYSVTYATEPAIGSAAGVFSVSQAGAFVAVDVTALVQGWIGNPASNNGVALSAGTAMVQFDSKENDLTAHTPTLDVELVDAGPAGAVGAAGPAGPQGPIGTSGLAGATGPAGAAGPAGATGANGATGPQGRSVQPGLQGQPGHRGRPGRRATAAGLELPGDIRFDGQLRAGRCGGLSGVELRLADRSEPWEHSGVESGGVGICWLRQGQHGTRGSSGSPTVAVSYQGVYASTTNYALNDIVLYGASSYISLIAGNAWQHSGTESGGLGAAGRGQNGDRAGGTGAAEHRGRRGSWTGISGGIRFNVELR